MGLGARQRPSGGWWPKMIMAHPATPNTRSGGQLQLAIRNEGSWQSGCLSTLMSYIMLYQSKSFYMIC